MKCVTALIFLVYCLLSEFIFAQVTKQELKICNAVDERTASAITLLKDAVNINSGTMNFEGVRKVGELFMEELKNLGFETRWSPGNQFHRAGHLVAVHKGKGKGKRFLLIRPS
jgi:glutamate carboxypeptidase